MSLNDLHRVWRIVVAVVVCQLLGGAASLLIGVHHFWFMNFWLGAAIGTLPGFIVGAVWHFSGGADRRNSIGVACFIGLIAVFLSVVAVWEALPYMKKEMRALSSMSRLQEETIRQVDVFDGDAFDRDGDKRILEVSDPAAITAFAQACSDVVGHSPNHPTYSHSWYVVVHANTTHEFELRLNPSFPRSVIGYFVSESGNTRQYHGSFESHALRPWVEQHLLKGNPKH